VRWGLLSVTLLVMFACAPRERAAPPVDREAALRATLPRIRAALAAYQKDHGRGPATLQELVPKYLPRVPVDPVTGKADWRLVQDERVTNDDFAHDAKPAEQPQIIDVRSSARPDL
jgi:hypothetical protein